MKLIILVCDKCETATIGGKAGDVCMCEEGKLTECVYVPASELAPARTDALREWFAAVDDAAITHWVLSDAIPPDDPRKMLIAIINRCVVEALDPQISIAASALVRRGYEQAREQAAQICKERDLITTMQIIKYMQPQAEPAR
jgi:hypothetical protein